MQYIPQTHTGTPEQIVQGLMDEAAEIWTSGIMRMHAQERELARISSALLENHGLHLMEGCDEDKGWLIAVGPHGAGCGGAVCKCPVKYRSKL